MRSSTASAEIILLPTLGRRPAHWFGALRARLARSDRSASSIVSRWDSFVRPAVRVAGLPQSRLEPAGGGAGTAPRFLTASVASEIGILLVLSVMFPFLIHILPVPEDARLGARLLPMFYAPLLAALLGRTRSALTVAVAAPWLNWALTTHPAPRGAIVIMVQLLVFVWVVRVFLKQLGARWFLAAPAYVASWAAAMIVAAIFPDLIGGSPVLAWASNSVKMALPGLGILLLINWLTVRFCPPGSGGGGPATA